MLWATPRVGWWCEIGKEALTNFAGTIHTAQLKFDGYTVEDQAFCMCFYMRVFQKWFFGPTLSPIYFQVATPTLKLRVKLWCGPWQLYTPTSPIPFLSTVAPWEKVGSCVEKPYLKHCMGADLLLTLCHSARRRQILIFDRSNVQWCV